MEESNTLIILQKQQNGTADLVKTKGLQIGWIDCIIFSVSSELFSISILN